METDVIAINRQGIVQRFQVSKDYSKYCQDIPACYFVDNITVEEKATIPFLSFDGVIEQLPPKIRKETKFDYDGKLWFEDNICKLKTLNNDPEKYTKLKNQIIKKIQYYELNESWVNKLSADISNTSIVKTEPELIKNEIAFKEAVKADNKYVEDKEEIKKTSLFIDENHIYEQIKKGNNNFFLKYNLKTQSIDETDRVDGEIQLFPIDDEEVMAGHIKLPTGIMEYGTEGELVESIENHVKKYLDVPSDYLHYAALNVLKSWAYDRYRSLNYLRVQGEPGTGKSRFLDVIGGLHYKPIATSGASTVAPIFRLINKWGCTLIMDEADLKQSDETNDLIKIINQGFEIDRPVIRCNPDDKSKVEFFKVYCPKVLSTRHAFEDVATESRCMTQIMTGTTRSDIVSSLNSNFDKEQQEIRNKLLLWRFRNYLRIQPDIGETLDWTGIEPRLKQVNVGFISLIHQDKNYTTKFMQRIKEQQINLISERSETYEGQIVSAISKIILDDKNIVAKTIVDYADLADTKGNKWKPRRVNSYMKTLGFKGTKVVRVQDITEKVYEYDNAVLLTLLKKYLIEDELIYTLKEILNKAKSLTTYNHSAFFCYCVTVVTIVYEQGKDGNKVEKVVNVTIPPSDTKHGNNGNIVTEPTEAQKRYGDVFESEPNVWRKTI